MKKKLFIISNESISHNEKFHCDNIDLKSTPEGLNKKFDVNLLGRKSKKNRVHEIHRHIFSITSPNHSVCAERNAYKNRECINRIPYSHHFLKSPADV